MKVIFVVAMALLVAGCGDNQALNQRMDALEESVRASARDAYTLKTNLADINNKVDQMQKVEAKTGEVVLALLKTAPTTTDASPPDNIMQGWRWFAEKHWPDDKAQQEAFMQRAVDNWKQAKKVQVPDYVVQEFTRAEKERFPNDTNEQDFAVKFDIEQWQYEHR